MMHATRIPRSSAFAALAILAVLAAAQRADATLLWSVSAASGWPSQAQHDAAVAAIQAVTDRYNAYGYFGDASVWVYYNAGIPTAQSSCGGSIGFGGSYPAERVMQHELAHFLCLPSGSWTTLMSGGVWSGPSADQLVRQFDGEQAELHGDSIHFWPYGLNYDSEGSALNIRRQVAMVYAMRADLGIGPSTHPSSATIVTAIASNPTGESGFNYETAWSDGYVPHSAADYYSDDFVIRTPATANSYNFYGNALTLNNTNAASGGLYYCGSGTASVITVPDLILDGGWIQHRSTLSDVFQLDGTLTVVSDASVCAKQGNINVLAAVAGSGNLTIEATDSPTVNDRYVNFLSSDNSFTGDIVNLARFHLADGANLTFVIGASGVNNAITGATARATALDGIFVFDLTGASTTYGDAWALVTAANVTYGRRFQVAGFTLASGIWTNDTYAFDPATGILSVLPPPTEWNVDGGGLWGDAGNWTVGVPAVGEDAVLGAVLTAPQAPALIDLNVPATLNRLTFDNANSYILGGGSALTLTGDAQLVATQGAHEVGVAVSGTAGLNVGGAGTIWLSAANPYSGNTNVAAGTLALVDAATLASTGQIDIAPGAQLDVTGLASTFTLGNGQTLNLSDGATVSGDLIAGGGALLAGTGVVAGHVTVADNGTLRIGGVGIPSTIPFDVIDDFESYDLGYVRDVASPPWTAHANTMYAAIEDESDNNVLSFGWTDDFRGASRTLSTPFALQDGAAATYFFRFECLTDTPNHTLGLGDLATTGEVAFTDYEVQIRLYADSNAASGTYGLDARSGSAYVDLVDGLLTGTWYNVWLVVNQATDRFDVYLNTGTADATTANKLNRGSLTFRNGTTTPLNTFLALAGAAPVDFGVRIDDLAYLDGVNLTNPRAPDGGVEFAAQTLTVDGDVVLATGATTALDIATPAATDVLNVTGNLTAGGTLDIQLEPAALQPQSGDAFNIIDAASTAGVFSAIAVTALGPRDVWDLRTLYTTGVIAVLAAADALDESLTCFSGPGNAMSSGCVSQDHDADGDVDMQDFCHWQRCVTSASAVLLPECLSD